MKGDGACLLQYQGERFMFEAYCCGARLAKLFCSSCTYEVSSDFFSTLAKLWAKLLPFVYEVLYVSFDKFLLAVESRDLSQADKSIIRVSFFPKLRMSSRTSFSASQQLRPELSAK